MIKRLLAIYEYWLDWKMRAKITSSILSVTLLSLATLLVTYFVMNSRAEAKRIGAERVILGNQILMRMAEKVTDELKNLETLAKTPSLIAAVHEANTSRRDWTTEIITQQDKAWKSEDATIERTVRDIANNPTSAYLVDFQKANSQEAELFITDSRGLNLAMTNRTSDFLQADEEWWQSTFAQGNGSVYLGPVEYDESSKVYAMDIGVPIRDPETKQAVGVLRGTLDISVMIDGLKNVEVGEAGDIVLVNSDGIVFYSHDPEHFLKPAPESMLSLLKSGESNWTIASDLHGYSAVVAYSSLDRNLDKSLGWHVLVTQSQKEINLGVIQNLLMSLAVGIVVVVVGILVSSMVITNSVSTPLSTLTMRAHELSMGNIHHNQLTAKDKLNSRKDEVGEISRAFEKLTEYFRNTAAASNSIANKDLTFSIVSNSASDELGNAFAKMVTELKSTIQEVTQNAETVAAAAVQLANASEQSDKATNQIATTIQQVATGITQQSEEINRTSHSVEQMGRAIEGVARGAQEQASAISKASHVTASINTAISQVASNAQSGVQGAAQAADAARIGAQTIETTIAGMQSIKTKVGLSVQRVREMGKRSEQIDTIVETIDEIASQTNLLALNAAIEAARVQSKSEKTVESLLQQHMLGAVGLVANILASGRELNSNDLVTLARQARVEDLCISDADGVVIAANRQGNLGFRFSEDPRQQSSAFRPLLTQREGVVIRPSMVRDQDGKPYIYVGISRPDRPGIVQAGTSAEQVYTLSGHSRGFGVVADEVGKLAEHAKSSTKEIAHLVRGLQKAVTEAVVVMEDGARDVESRSAQATEAGRSLSAILKDAEAVSRQVGEIAEAVQHMSAASNELVSAMETVSAVVEQNTAATEEMAASSNEMMQAMENIASVSEENSAAIEEVSASTEQVLAQVEYVSTAAASLTKMAQALQQIVAQFALVKNQE